MATGVAPSVSRAENSRPATSRVPIAWKKSGVTILYAAVGSWPGAIGGWPCASKKTLPPPLSAPALFTPEIVSQTYGSIRFPMTFLWIFAALALVLSAVGIFGVMSYTVSRRSREMAIRMALGASRREVQGMVLREGLRVTAIGVAIGLAAALALSRVMAGYVYGITSTDPVTLVGASLLLMLVSLLASYVPARRATRVDPMTALRYE
jgi:hypothetical protein